MKTVLLLLVLALVTSSQTKQQRPRTVSVDPDVAALHQEFIQANEEYKLNLTKLEASYQKDVDKAEARLTQSQEMFDAGLISPIDLEKSKRALAEAKDKVAEVRKRGANADTQIAQALLDQEAAAKEYKKAKVQRRVAKQQPCSNWTVTATQRQTKRSYSLNYKFICLN